MSGNDDFKVNDRRSSGREDIRSVREKAGRLRKMWKFGMRKNNTLNNETSKPRDEQPPKMPAWVKIASAVVFPTCMIAGFIYLRSKDSGNTCAGPGGAMLGAAAGSLVMFVLFLIWAFFTQVVDRQWSNVRLMIKVAAGLAACAVPGYLLIGVNGIFGGIGIAIGLFYIIFSITQRDVSEEYESVGWLKALVVFFIILLFVGGIWSDWKEQYGKTGKAWHLSTSPMTTSANETVLPPKQSEPATQATQTGQKLPENSEVEDNSKHLLLYVSLNNADEVRSLLAKGADVNGKVEGGITALHMAAGLGNTEAARVLLKNGARINVKTDEGMTPLAFAASSGKADMVRLLIENGAKVKEKGDAGETALHWAAGKGHFAVARILIAKGASVDEQTYAGWTPLHWAAIHGKIEVSRLLIGNGAKAGLKNADGKTPLDLAQENGQAEVVKLLKPIGKTLK